MALNAGYAVFRLFNERFVIRAFTQDSKAGSLFRHKSLTPNGSLSGMLTQLLVLFNVYFIMTNFMSITVYCQVSTGDCYSAYQNAGNSHLAVAELLLGNRFDIVDHVKNVGAYHGFDDSALHLTILNIESILGNT